MPKKIKVNQEIADAAKELTILCQYHELMPITELLKKRNLKNRNKHSVDQIKDLAYVMKHDAIRHPIILDHDKKEIRAGHGRLDAAILNGWQVFPVQMQPFSSEDAAYAFHVADNALAQRAEVDLAGINIDLSELGPDLDIKLLGLDDFEIEPADKLSPKSNKPKSSAVTCPQCGHAFDK